MKSVKERLRGSRHNVAIVTILGLLAGVGFGIESAREWANKANHNSRKSEKFSKDQLKIVLAHLPDSSFDIATVHLKDLNSSERSTLGVEIKSPAHEPGDELHAHVNSSEIDGPVTLPSVAALKTDIKHQAEKASDINIDAFIGQGLLGGAVFGSLAFGMVSQPTRRRAA